MSKATEGLPAPSLFGHPRGLAVLAGLEIWDRISFYGMQSLLVLYMVGQLLLPGHVERIVGFGGFRSALEGVFGPLSVQALAVQIFGLYAGLTALTPIFGGFLGDRLLGRKPAVILGALLMTAGHFAMAFDQSFLAALVLLVAGAGFVRGNVTPQIGELYEPNDRRRGVAFQIYGSVINLGAFIAPLITGALGQAYGWHVGFGFAGFGMMIGLIIYTLGSDDLPAGRPAARKGTGVLLTAPEKRIVLKLLALVPISALFWIAQSQIWNTYNLWARDHLELRFGAWTMPVPWLQSLDGLAPFALLPPLLMYWRWQARRGRELDELNKAAVGCLIFGAATLLLAGAQFLTDAAGRTPLMIAVIFHFVSNLGWLFFTPSMNSLYSRLGPKSVNATLLGLNSVSVTLGSFVSGWMGGYYGRLPPVVFWGAHAGVVILAGLVLFFAARHLRNPVQGDDQIYDA